MIRWIHFSDLHFGNDNAVETEMMRRRQYRCVIRIEDVGFDPVPLRNEENNFKIKEIVIICGM